LSGCDGGDDDDDDDDDGVDDDDDDDDDDDTPVDAFVVQNMYEDRSLRDEHAWAGAWLYKATGEGRYLNRTLEHYWQCCSGFQDVGAPWRVFSWAEKSLGVNLLLYEVRISLMRFLMTLSLA
jgi:hypothetical protein